MKSKAQSRKERVQELKKHIQDQLRLPERARDTCWPDPSLDFVLSHEPKWVFEKSDYRRKDNTPRIRVVKFIKQK